MSLSEDLELARLLLALPSSTLLLGVPFGRRNPPCGFSATMLCISELVHEPHYSPALNLITLSEGGRAIKRGSEKMRQIHRKIVHTSYASVYQEVESLNTLPIRFYIECKLFLTIQTSKWLNPPQCVSNLPKSYNPLCPLQSLHSGVLSVPRTAKLRVGGKSFYLLAPKPSYQ